MAEEQFIKSAKRGYLVKSWHSKLSDEFDKAEYPLLTDEKRNQLSEIMADFNANDLTLFIEMVETMRDNIS